ncbi:MAG: leucine-rich repeat domain-containing protein [Treponematales bacterium]
MKKQFLFIALCVSAAALLLAGCPVKGDDDDGNDGNGETAALVITRVEDLADGLKGPPWNDVGSPYTVVLKGMDIRTDWGAINDAVREAEQYVTLDLSACSVGREITGTELIWADGYTPSGSDFNIIWDNKYITAVILPNTLKSIGDYAFYGCGYLTSVTIPASVTSIGDYAFYGCTGLTSITIPASVTSIGNGAFSGCTGLTSITIPASVTSIGNGAFSGCASLSAITVDAANTAFFVQDGVLYDKPATRVVAVPAKLAGAVTIPSGVISVKGFNGTAITSVTIPDSVTSIGSSAFSYCTKLTSVTIPASVTSIENYAFSGCAGLTSITIPDSVTSIGSGAFYSCTGLTSVTIGSGVTSIGDSAFSWCTGLTSVTIPASVTRIGNMAFNGCTALTSVTFQGSGTAISYDTFSSGLFDYGSSLLEAGGAVYDNGYTMSAGTYTREPDGEVWAKQQ